MEQKDKLDVIFELQNKFDTDLADRRGLHDIDSATWIQKEVLAMISELGELLDEVNFKWWKNEKPVDEAAVKGELVDILHFFVSMCLKMDMTATELYELYLEKNRENFRRQDGLSEKSGYVSPKV
ncbi:MAG: dUTPase [Christensenellales bacterium]|jgi:dimeric dUTPase (all-alpha-NTP-PPase superfamily)